MSVENYFFPAEVVGPLPRWKYWLLPFKYFPTNPFSKKIAQQVWMNRRGKKEYYLKLTSRRDNG